MNLKPNPNTARWGVGSGEWEITIVGGGLLYAIPWLGDEDSNLDRQSQSLQSYH